MSVPCGNSISLIPPCLWNSSSKTPPPLPPPTPWPWNSDKLFVVCYGYFLESPNENQLLFSIYHLGRGVAEDIYLCKNKCRKFVKKANNQQQHQASHSTVCNSTKINLSKPFTKVKFVFGGLQQET